MGLKYDVLYADPHFSCIFLNSYVIELNSTFNTRTINIHFGHKETGYWDFLIRVSGYSFEDELIRKKYTDHLIDF